MWHGKDRISVKRCTRHKLELATSTVVVREKRWEVAIRFVWPTGDLG